MGHSYNKGDEPIPGYRLVKPLGRGGFGEVWKATAPGGTEVALKIINLEDKQSFKEFRAIKTVKKVLHPNLVPIVSFWLKDSQGNIFNDAADGDSFLQSKASELIIAMTLGEKNLLDRLRECQAKGDPGIPSEELLEYMEATAKAIDFLNQPNHDLGSGKVAIQHCDIKPQNIMIVGGSAQVCDFGLARVLGDTRVTSNKAMSAPYTPPELIKDTRPSQSSDQYSLAISFYELRTGCLPFDNPTPAGMVYAHVLGNLNFSKLAAAELAVVKRATDLDPSRRYPTTVEMVRDLRRAINNETGPRSGPKSSKSLDILNPGSELVPGYKLIKLLGRGGYGTVWEASAPGGKHIALKIIRNLEAVTGKQEFKALELIKSLEHNHLLELHAYWLLDKEGETIAEEVRQQPNGPAPSTLVIASRLANKNLIQRLNECIQEGSAGIPARELIDYMRQAADAIDYLNSCQHRRGPEDRQVSIQHRDIKPENILLVRDTIKVGDFGLAKVVEGTSALIHQDSTGMTPTYAAPEIFSNQITTWSDQYSLALTYYKLRTGKLPFDSSLPYFDLMMAHVEGRLDLGLLSEAEYAVIKKATSVTPESRFPTCTAMVAALVEAASGELGLVNGLSTRSGLVERPTITPRPPFDTGTLASFSSPRLDTGTAKHNAGMDDYRTVATPRIPDLAGLSGDGNGSKSGKVNNDNVNTVAPVRTAVNSSARTSGLVETRPGGLAVGPKQAAGWRGVATVKREKQPGISLSFKLTVIGGFCLIGGLTTWGVLNGKIHPWSGNRAIQVEKPSAGEDTSKASASSNGTTAGSSSASVSATPKDETPVKSPEERVAEEIGKEMNAAEILLNTDPLAAATRFAAATEKMKSAKVTEDLREKAYIGETRAYARMTPPRWDKVRDNLSSFPARDMTQRALKVALEVLAEGSAPAPDSAAQKRLLDWLLKLRRPENLLSALEPYENDQIEKLESRVLAPLVILIQDDLKTGPYNMALQDEALALAEKISAYDPDRHGSLLTETREQAAANCQEAARKQWSWNPDKPFGNPFPGEAAGKAYVWLTKALDLLQAAKQLVPKKLRGELALAAWYQGKRDGKMMDKVAAWLKDFQSTSRIDDFPFLLVKARAQQPTLSGRMAAFESYEGLYAVIEENKVFAGKLSDTIILNDVLTPALEQGDAIVKADAEATLRQRVGKLTIAQGKRIRSLPETQKDTRELGKVLDCFTKAVNLVPDDPNFRLERGQLDVELAQLYVKKSAEQKQCLYQAVDDADVASSKHSHPDYAYNLKGIAFEDIAWILEETPRYDDAIKAFTLSIKKDPLGKYFMDRGRCFYKWAAFGNEGKYYADARQDLEKAVAKQLRPDFNVEALFYLGMVYGYAPEPVYVQAKRRLEEAADVADRDNSFEGFHPYALEALVNLGDLTLKKLGDGDGENQRTVFQCHDMLRRLSGKCPDKDYYDFYAETLLIKMGAYLETKNEPIRALEIYNRGIPTNLASARESHVRLLSRRFALFAKPDFKEQLKGKRPPVKEILRAADRMVELVLKPHPYFKGPFRAEIYAAAGLCYQSAADSENQLAYRQDCIERMEKALALDPGYKSRWYLHKIIVEESIKLVEATDNVGKKDKFKKLAETHIKDALKAPQPYEGAKDEINKLADKLTDKSDR